MQIGIISDTHDNVTAIEAAVDSFRDRDVPVVLHCGDFIAPPVVEYFDGFELHGVLGNNDGELDGLDKAIRAIGKGSTLHGRFADLSFDEAHFAVLHGEDVRDVDALAEAQSYDYVCYGHHHVSEVRAVGETTVLNPGAHFPTVPEAHRTIAIVDTDTDEVELVRVG